MRLFKFQKKCVHTFTIRRGSNELSLAMIGPCNIYRTMNRMNVNLSYVLSKVMWNAHSYQVVSLMCSYRAGNQTNFFSGRSRGPRLFSHNNKHRSFFFFFFIRRITKKWKICRNLKILVPFIKIDRDLIMSGTDDTYVVATFRCMYVVLYYTFVVGRQMKWAYLFDRQNKVQMTDAKKTKQRTKHFRIFL